MNQPPATAAKEQLRTFLDEWHYPPCQGSLYISGTSNESSPHTQAQNARWDAYHEQRQLLLDTLADYDCSTVMLLREMLISEDLEQARAVKYKALVELSETVEPQQKTVKDIGGSQLKKWLEDEDLHRQYKTSRYKETFRNNHPEFTVQFRSRVRKRRSKYGFDGYEQLNQEFERRLDADEL